MKYGVVYKFKSDNKINGTLFYCFEYFKFLKKFVDVKFYIVDITKNDLELTLKIFEEKYNTSFEDIIPVKITELYKVKLDRTIILDILTFYDCKEFLTNEIHCFSNDTHELFRYKNDRTVTYYGSYDYQSYDVFSYLKLNFEIFKPCSNQSGVFVSCLDSKYIRYEYARLQNQFNKPIILKKRHTAVGDLFDQIDSVHYIHVVRDTNNRIIPEAFFYNKKVTIEDLYPILDSVQLRYQDCLLNGLTNYTLTENDEIIKACLR
jgi:hypothetical protein